MVATLCFCLGFTFCGAETLAYLAARLQYQRRALEESIIWAATALHCVGLGLTIASTFMSSEKGCVWVILNTAFLCLGIMGIAWSIVTLILFKRKIAAYYEPRFCFYFLPFSCKENPARYVRLRYAPLSMTVQGYAVFRARLSRFAVRCHPRTK